MAMPRNVDARMYSRVAKQRYDEASLILDKLELWAASQYLAGYAVECIFKALLITVTPPAQRPAPGDETIEWLKKEFGHDLDDLRRAIARRGAPLPRALAGEFVFVATWNPNSRYKPGPGDPAEATRFLAAVERIVKWASERM